MCGRFSISLPPEQVARYFKVPGPLPNVPARYNMAPTQDAPLVRFNAETGHRHLDLLRWGLIPSWAKDMKIGNRLINARCETLATKPAFKAAFAKGRRCIVPANGFFEWKKSGDRKQPFFITLKSGEPMGFSLCGSRRKITTMGRRFTITYRIGVDALSAVLWASRPQTA